MGGAPFPCGLGARLFPADAAVACSTRSQRRARPLRCPSEGLVARARRRAVGLRDGSRTTEAGRVGSWRSASGATVLVSKVDSFLNHQLDIDLFNAMTPGSSACSPVVTSVPPSVRRLGHRHRHRGRPPFRRARGDSERPRHQRLAPHPVVLAAPWPRVIVSRVLGNF